MIGRAEQWGSHALKRQDEIMGGVGGMFKSTADAQPEEPANPPDSFDAATHWPKCAALLGLVRDQGRCGCSYAFAAVNTFNDRLCTDHSILIRSKKVLTQGHCSSILRVKPMCTETETGNVTMEERPL